MLSFFGAGTLAHAAISVTTEVSSIRYETFSLDGSATPPPLTFVSGSAWLSGSLRSEGDDGLFWTPATLLDEASNSAEGPLSGFSPAADLRAESVRDHGQASGVIEAGAQARMALSLRLEDGQPPAPHKQWATSANESIETMAEVTLAPRSYVRFEATSFLAIVAPQPQGTLPEGFRQWTGAGVTLETSGPGAAGAGLQKGHDNIMVSLGTGLDEAPDTSASRTLTAYLYNSTDAPLTGQVSLRLQAFAQLNQPAPVPEPESIALALAGLATAGLALRRRARRLTRGGVCAGAVLGMGLGAMGSAGATPRVDASIGFTQIQFTLHDLDPGDGIAPALTVPGPGSFGNTASSYITVTDLTDWSVEDDEVVTQPTTDGGLFGMEGIQSSVRGNSVNLSSQEDPQGSSIVLSLAATSERPGFAHLNTSVALWPGTDSAERGIPSFTLGARSHVTLTMQVDVHAVRTGIVGFEENAVVSGFWDLALFDAGPTGIPRQSMTDQYQFTHYGDELELHSTRTLSYNFYNPGDTPIDGVLALRAGLQGSAQSPVTSVVPEPQGVVLMLAGLGIVLGASRHRAQRGLGRS